MGTGDQVEGNMRIYFDLCALNRPFDDQQQDRIRLEAEAVLMVLDQVQAGNHKMLGSDVLDFENGKNPDEERRNDVENLLSMAESHVTLSRAVAQRARLLEDMGFAAYDALHVASAEAGAADVLLTTDDGMIRLAGKLRQELKVRVINPVTWVEEGAA